MGQIKEQFCENLKNAEILKEKLKKNTVDADVIDELVMVLAGLDAQFPVFDTSPEAAENEKTRYMDLKKELSNNDSLHLRRLEKDPAYRAKHEKIAIDNIAPYHY